MSASTKNYRSAALWILLSPLLFLMAAISTVEPLTTYYVQLACFGVVTLSGVVTGIGFIFGWPWVNISAKYLKGLIFIYFVGSLLLIGLFLIWHWIVGV